MFNFFIVLSSFLVGVILTPLLIRFSEKKHALVDVADGDALKIHKKPISLFGGVGMVAAIVVGFLFLADMKVTGILFGLLIIFCLGVWDDFKWKHISTIKPMTKFLLLLFSCLVSTLILFFLTTSFYFLPWSVAAIILSFCWIFVLINAVNYQDGMDGLAGSLVSFSLVALLVIALLLHNQFLFALAIIVLAAIFAFLVFNLPPASVFMGDSGAYSLGFLLAAITMMLVKPYNVLTILGIIFIVGLPLFDGVFTNIRRIAAGKSIFLGDRSHFYDRLMQKGFSTWKTLLICCSIQAVSVIIGIVLIIHG